MGLSDLVLHTLHKFEADTSDLRAKIKELQGDEKQLAEARLKQADQHNETIEGTIKSYTKLIGSIGAIKEGAEIAFKAIEEYGHRLDLEAAAAGVSIDRMARAAGGLKTNMDLLEHAARLNKSAFKLTQDQMDMVERAMYALEERGNSSQEVWAAFDAALSKGTVRSLEKFGVIIDTTKLKLDENGAVLDKYGQRAEALKAVFDGLNKSLGEEMKNATHDQADAVQAQVVQLKNAWESIKGGLASLATAFTPVLEQLASTLGLISKIASVDIPGGGSVGKVLKFGTNMFGVQGVKGYYDNINTIRGEDVLNPSVREALGKMGYNLDSSYDTGISPEAFRAGRYVAPENAAAAIGLMFGGRANTGNPAYDALLTGNNVAATFARGAYRPTQGPEMAPDNSEALLIALAGIEGNIRGGIDRYNIANGGDPWALHGAGGEGPSAAALALLRARLGGEGRGADQNLYAPYAGSFGGASSNGAGFGQDYDVLGLQHQIAALGDFKTNPYRDFLSKKNASFLESTFGKPDEFNVYQSLFQGLSDAVGGTFEAIVTGSEPAGQAFKKLIGQAVMATGKGELVEGLKEAAWAIGRLAIGDFAGAALHGESAAQHFAVAALAGVIAAELGAGGSPSKPSPGARPSAPSGGGGGGGGGGGTADRIIIYGPDFTDDSARMRQQKAKRLVDLAMGTSSTRDN